MTTQEVIDLITPIPEEQFCVSDYYKGSREDPICCCVLGHLNKVCTGNPSGWFESIEDSNDSFDSRNSYSTKSQRSKLGLRHRSNLFLRSVNSNFTDVASINNKQSIEYPQPTPKQRVLALLNDMLAAGY